MDADVYLSLWRWQYGHTTFSCMPTSLEVSLGTKLRFLSKQVICSRQKMAKTTKISSKAYLPKIIFWGHQKNSRNHLYDSLEEKLPGYPGKTFFKFGLFKTNKIKTVEDSRMIFQQHCKITGNCHYTDCSCKYDKSLNLPH